MKIGTPEKIEWHGTIVSVQPRTTVWRYKIDNRTHSHIGYNLFLSGVAKGQDARISVAISEKQQQKLVFRIGDEVKGTAWTKMYSVTDYADYYRAGALKILKRGEQGQAGPPPYKIQAPDMAAYAWRGARKLDKSAYKKKCFPCVWAAMAAVEIEYNWGVKKSTGLRAFVTARSHAACISLACPALFRTRMRASTTIWTGSTRFSQSGVARMNKGGF
jgi:hypothetical protein